MTTLHEFARHSSHKADDDFLALRRDFVARMKVVYKFRWQYKLDSGVVVKESCLASKGGSAQNRRKGNNANVIFWVGGISNVQKQP